MTRLSPTVSPRGSKSGKASSASGWIRIRPGWTRSFQRWAKASPSELREAVVAQLPHADRARGSGMRRREAPAGLLRAARRPGLGGARAHCRRGSRGRPAGDRRRQAKRRPGQRRRLRAGAVRIDADSLGRGRRPAADAATVGAFLGRRLAGAPRSPGPCEADAGLFVLVRTSNPGAGDLLDLPAPEAPLFERLAALVAERADRLMGECGLSGVGAVVGATEPRHLSRLRRADAALDLPGPRGGGAGRPRRRTSGRPSDGIRPPSW